MCGIEHLLLAWCANVEHTSAIMATQHGHVIGLTITSQPAAVCRDQCLAHAQCRMQRMHTQQAGEHGMLRMLNCCRQVECSMHAFIAWRTVSCTHPMHGVQHRTITNLNRCGSAMSDSWISAPAFPRLRLSRTVTAWPVVYHIGYKHRLCNYCGL